MAEKYYLDSCIWRDYFENRSDKFRPLGDWAFELIKKIINEDNIIFYSELVEEELGENYSKDRIKNIFSIVPKQLLIKVSISDKQLIESIQISRRLKIPRKDALHAVLARDNKAIMITRDKHLFELQNEVEILKPEELI